MDDVRETSENWPVFNTVERANAYLGLKQLGNNGSKRNEFSVSLLRNDAVSVEIIQESIIGR
jgi:hypothetical protein